MELLHNIRRRLQRAGGLLLKRLRSGLQALRPRLQALRRRLRGLCAALQARRTELLQALRPRLRALRLGLRNLWSTLRSRWTRLLQALEPKLQSLCSTLQARCAGLLKSLQSGLQSLRRSLQALRAKLRRLRPKPWSLRISAPALRTVWILLGPLAILLCCQTVSLQGLEPAYAWIAGHRGAAALTFLLLLCVLWTLYGLTRLLSLSFLLTAAVPVALTLVSYYRMVINGEPLMLTDFSLLGQFAGVAGFAVDRITVSPDTRTALLLLLRFLCAALLVDVGVERAPREGRLYRAGLAFSALVIGVSIAGSTYCVEAYRTHDTQVERDRACGVPLSLLSTYLGSEAAGSEAYSELRMKRLLLEMEAALPTPAGEKPHIIFVMNESFFDVTRMPHLTFSADPLPNYHRLESQASYGRFYTTTCGGGTGWVEMQVFNGVARDLLSPDRANTDLTAEEYALLPSYVRVLKENGYHTAAFHAHTSEMYNRAINYPEIGFDEVLFFEPFKTGATYEGGYFDDSSSADVIISLFEKYREDPTYIYTMTMQNHQPYYAGRYSEDRVKVESDRLTAEDLEVLQCYVNGICDADRMLGKLTDYFARVEEPVILVFAGDHVPSLYLSETETVYSKLGYVDAPLSADWSLPEYQRMLSTDYMLWTNFSAGEGEKDTSCTVLGAEILRRAGTASTPYFAWLARRGEELLFHTGSLWIGPDGELLEEEDGPGAAAWRDNQDILYDLLYGEGYIAGEINQVQASPAN